MGTLHRVFEKPEPGRQPLNAVWPREQFLEARRRQMEATYRNASPNDIIIDPEDEIICDDCNADVAGPDVFVVLRGRRAVCGTCFNRYLLEAERGMR